MATTFCTAWHNTGARNRLQPRVLVDKLAQSSRIIASDWGLAPDRIYRANWLSADLQKNSITLVKPGKRNREWLKRQDRRRYRERWRIEAMLNCLKNFRRIAARYDQRTQLRFRPRPGRRHAFQMLIKRGL